MKILVTGSSGFLGSSLTSRLNGDVVLYDQQHDLSESLDNKKLLRSKLKDVNIVFHLAGISDPTSPNLNNVNVDGTRNLIEAITTLKQETKIIFASTFGVYKIPQKGDLINENHLTIPRNAYGKSKLEAEKIILSNPENIVLRFSNIYGPNMVPGRHSVVTNFIDSIKNNKKVIIYDKNATRDFLYIDDAVESLIKASEVKVGGVFNICSGEETSIIELIKIVEKKMGKKAILDLSNPFQNSGYWRGDYSKAKDILNWNPKINLNIGLLKTI